MFSGTSIVLLIYNSQLKTSSSTIYGFMAIVICFFLANMCVIKKVSRRLSRQLTALLSFSS